MKSPTLSKLNDVWQRILKDPDARRALVRLEKKGFRLIHLSPQDPTFKQPSWADYVAALPFLSNRASRRRIHRQNMRKYIPLLSTLRHFAEKFDDPFCEKEIVTTQNHSVETPHNLGGELLRAIALIEKVLSWDWYARDLNARNALIAELRSTIRTYTGTPHDRELSTLIDAAFRAAGVGDGLYLDATTLDRIEQREKEGRVKATSRLNYITGVSRTPKIPRVTHSTRLRPKRGNRV